MSAMEQLNAIGDGADRLSRSVIQTMLRSVESGKVNFADIFPKNQKVWQKIPMIVNDLPLQVQCDTLLNMSNGNREVAVRKVVEGHFEASPQPDHKKAAPSKVSSFIDKFYSSNGLSMAGFVTKQVLGFVLPGNVVSYAEAVAYLLSLRKQGLELVELFVWLKTTFWGTLRNVALIALLRGQRLDDKNVQDLLLWCFLQRAPADTSTQQSNLETLVGKISTAVGAEKGAMDKIRALFPEDSTQWQRMVLEKANVLFSPRKQYVMAEVVLLCFLWLLPVLCGISENVTKLWRFLAKHHATAAISVVVGLVGLVIVLFRRNPSLQAKLAQWHPLTLLTNYPSTVVFGVLVCVPGVLHITNAHRFGVAAVETFGLLPSLFSPVGNNTVTVDGAVQTLTVVLTFSPFHARLLQSMHVLAICSCSFAKTVLKASLKAQSSSPEARRKKWLKAASKAERIFLVATLLWPVMMAVEYFWFEDLDPSELVLREGKVWWLVKYAAKIIAVSVEGPLWKTLMSADFLAQILTTKNVVQGLFASVGAFWYIFYLAQDSHVSLKQLIESLTPVSWQCSAIVVSRHVAFGAGVLLALLTSSHWKLPSVLQQAIVGAGVSPAVVTILMKGMPLCALVAYVWFAYRRHRRQLGAGAEGDIIRVRPKGHWRRLLRILPPGMAPESIDRFLESLDDLMNSPGPVSEVFVQPWLPDTAGATARPGIELLWNPADGAECYEIAVVPWSFVQAKADRETLVAQLLRPSDEAQQKELLQYSLATKPAWEARCAYSFEELVSLRTNSFSSSQADAKSSKTTKPTKRDKNSSRSVAHDLVFRVRGVSTRTGVKLAGAWSPWSKIVWGRHCAGAVEFSDHDIPAIVPAGLDEFRVFIRQAVGIPGAMVPWDEADRCPNDIVGIFESTTDLDKTTHYAKRGLTTNLKNWSWQYMQSAKRATPFHEARSRRKSRHSSARQQSQLSFPRRNKEGSADDDVNNSVWHAIKFLGEQLPTSSALVPTAPVVDEDDPVKNISGQRSDSESLIDFDELAASDFDEEVLALEDGTPPRSNSDPNPNVSRVGLYEFRYIAADGMVLARSRQFAIRPLSVRTEISVDHRHLLMQSPDPSTPTGSQQDRAIARVARAASVTLFAVWEPMCLPTGVGDSTESTNDGSVGAAPSLRGSSDSSCHLTSNDRVSEFVHANKDFDGCIQFRYSPSGSLLSKLVGKWIDIPASEVTSCSVGVLTGAKLDDTTPIHGSRQVLQQSPESDLSDEEEEERWSDGLCEDQRVVCCAIPGDQLTVGAKYVVQVRFHDPKRGMTSKWSKSATFVFESDALSNINESIEFLKNQATPLALTDGTESPDRLLSTTGAKSTSARPDGDGKPPMLPNVEFQVHVPSIRSHCALVTVGIKKGSGCQQNAEVEEDVSKPADALGVSYFEVQMSTTSRFSRWSSLPHMSSHTCISRDNMLASTLVKSLSPQTDYCLRVRAVLEPQGSASSPTNGPWFMQNFRTPGVDDSNSVESLRMATLGTEGMEGVVAVQVARDSAMENYGIEVEVTKRSGFLRGGKVCQTRVFALSALPRVTNDAVAAEDQMDENSATAEGQPMATSSKLQTLSFAFVVQDLLPAASYRVRCRMLELQKFQIQADEVQTFDTDGAGLTTALVETAEDGICCVLSDEGTTEKPQWLANVSSKFSNPEYQSAFDGLLHHPERNGPIGVVGYLAKSTWSSEMAVSTLASPAVPILSLSLASIDEAPRSAGPPTAGSVAESDASDTDDISAEKSEQAKASDTKSTDTNSTDTKSTDTKSTNLVTLTASVRLPDIHSKSWRPSLAPIGNCEVQYCVDSRLGFWKTLDVSSPTSGTSTEAPIVGKGRDGSISFDNAMVELSNFIDNYRAQGAKGSVEDQNNAPHVPQLTISLPPLSSGSMYLVRARFQSLPTTAQPKPRFGEWSGTVQVNLTQQLEEQKGPTDTVVPDSQPLVEDVPINENGRADKNADQQLEETEATGNSEPFDLEELDELHTGDAEVEEKQTED